MQAGRHYRLRSHLHAGSTSEILARFQQFGLGEAHVGVIFGGCVTNSSILQAWLDERLELERRAANAQVVEAAVEEDEVDNHGEVVIAEMA